MKDFVCVRIDSYESEEAQKLVRSHLRGAFANTAFCILSPDGKTRLTRSGRGPHQVLGGDLPKSLDAIAGRYRREGDTSEVLVPDFPNVKLALNVASADQRLLVLTTGSQEQIQSTRQGLEKIANDPVIRGRFHYDFESDSEDYKSKIANSSKRAGILIVEPGRYGHEGRVLKALPHSTEGSQLKDALVAANRQFAETTEKKVYRQYLREARLQNIDWVMPVEFGEDRDGDGKIDPRPRGRHPRGRQ